MTSQISGIWGWVPFIGGLILAAVLLFAVITNRRQPRDEIDRSERGARELREQIDREDDE